ncbi:hypothetical protein V1478_002218 [Vespula squamosa]|uniref:PiggyBac transposable element-derived protein domain-containing protein n=1 Tax=Vespula squamosa TaxID=30214 RepID=A0ABD2BW67_VESSQ
MKINTKHKSIQTNNDRKQIPETVVYYNKIKFRVDVSGQMARKYNVKSKSYRWLVQAFFNIFDFSGINAWIPYKETSAQNIARQQFLLQITEELSSRRKGKSTRNIKWPI